MLIRDFAALFSATVCVAVVSACASKAPPTDPLAQRLVGRWSQVFVFDDVRDELAIDLEPDATVRVKVRRHSGSGIREYSGSGKWRVEEGHFISKLDFHGPDNAVNRLAGHRILAVTEWQWVWELPHGEQFTAWRYPR